MKNNSNMTTNPFLNIYCQEINKIENYKSVQGYNKSISPIIN